MAKGSAPGQVCFFHRNGKLCLCPDTQPSQEALSFLTPYGDPWSLYPELCRFAAEENCGDLILFGAYDGERIVCFDDQVGGHGSVGGEQLFPFLILPTGHPVLSRPDLRGFNFLYQDVFMPYRQNRGPERKHSKALTSPSSKTGLTAPEIDASPSVSP